MKTAATTKRIGFLGFDGVATLDLLAPLEAFARARIAGSGPCYEIVLLGLTNKRFVSASGVVLKAQTTIAAASDLDTLLIPGGRGLREAALGRVLSAWLAAQEKPPRRFAAVATGIYALAQAGLLDERQVATHWRVRRDLAQSFPSLRVHSTSSFVKDGSFYTCGGGAAGVEMAMFLIQEDFGAAVALAVARELEIHLRPPGDDEPGFEPATCRPGPADRLADLPSFIATHLREALSVEALAGRAGLSRRHFDRLFRSLFHTSPAEFVEQMRLGEARRRLFLPHYSVASVAGSVGYKDPDVFRRAFARRFGATPRAFRKRVPLRAVPAPVAHSATHSALLAEKKAA